jgi:hypothetical protein
MPAKNHGAIILGDSSAIVTEKDPKKLSDLVTDLQPDIPPAASQDTPVKSAEKPTAITKKDSATLPTAEAPDNGVLPDVPGLKAEFKEISLLVPGITARISGNPNLKNANSAIYTLLSGSLEHGVIRTQGNVTKVSQKTQSVVILKTKFGTLPLDNLTAVSDWQPVKGSKSSYFVRNIEEEALPVPKANSAAIKAAVTRACNKRKLNHKKLQEWLASVSSVRATNQRPLVVTVRSVIWKIDGKDDKGKTFSKQIRVDIPI